MVADLNLNLNLPLLLLLLLVCAVGVCVSQRSDQTYITIRPQRLVVNESKVAGQVRITCRQLPISSAAQPAYLKMSRKPRNVPLGGSADEEPLFTYRQDGSLQRQASNPGLFSVRGDLRSQMVVTIVRATCRDAVYTYICRSKLSGGVVNVASTTFAAVITEPSITLSARPKKTEYAKTDKLALICTTKQAIGLDTSTRGVWVWEYNDLGRWLPARSGDVKEKNPITKKCFKRVDTTVLMVRVADFTACSRRFRCYVSREDGSGSDRAQEFIVTQNLEKCTGQVKILGTDPVVAIVVVLAVIAITVTAAYYLCMYSRQKRRLARAERQKQIEDRILSPLTHEERDKLLDEKLKKKEEDGPAEPPKPPESEQEPIRLTEDFLSTGGEKKARSERNVSSSEDEDEDNEEDEGGKKTKKGKKDKDVVVVVEVDTDSQVDSTTTEHEEDPSTQVDENSSDIPSVSSTAKSSDS